LRVFIYFNLHRKLWSVKALEGPHKGKVISHCLDFSLHNCTMKVSEAGRQRVLRERRKNVHAGIVGQWDHWRLPLPLRQGGAYPQGALHRLDNLLPDGRITYNPYRSPTFTDVDTGEPVKGAARVYALGRNVYYEEAYNG
jgi:hypothetical protein